MEASEIQDVEEKFLDEVIENFKNNSKDGGLYSKEEVVKFLNKLY